MSESVLTSEGVLASGSLAAGSSPTPRCPICSAACESTFRVTPTDPDHIILSVADNPFAELEFNGCRYCGFSWGTPYVDADVLARFYEKIYYQKVKHRTDRQNAKSRGFVPLDPRSVSQALLARMFKSFRAGQTVLDIGPGQGRSFRAISQIIPGLKYFAFEPDLDLSSLLRDFLEVHVFPHRFPSEPVAGTLVEGRRFDLVLMSHVLEHFNGTDAVAVLKNVRDLVAEDGILLCEVPCCDWRQQDQVMGNDPSHLSLFSIDSLRVALIEAGFKVEFLDTCSQTYESWRNALAGGEGAASEAGRDNAAGSRLRSLYDSLPVALPRRLVERLYSFMIPDHSARLLLSDDFEYGGDRTCLRAVASIAQRN